MFVNETGPADAPTILFVHGAGVAGWMWNGQVAALKANYHCLIPDLPRHGKTGGTERFTFEATVELLADLIRTRAHGGRAHVVGLSLGGSLTIELLAWHSELLHSAIISAPAFGPFPIHLHLLTRLMATFTSKDFFIRQNAKIMQIPPEDFEEFRHSQKQLTGPIIMEIMDAINSLRLNPTLRDVPVRTLTVVGEKEMAINKRAALLVAETMPNAIHRVAPGCHHAWNGERPDLFNAMIRAWVDGTPLPDELMGVDQPAVTTHVANPT